MKLFDNKPIFKNITTYNSKVYNKFIKFHNNKYGNKYMYFTILISLLFIYCIIANIIAQNILLSLILCFIMILFWYYKLYRPMSNYKKTCKIFSNSKQKSFTLVFYDYYFKINNAKTLFYYFRLQKIIEDNEFFYLYIDNDNAVLVNKNSFILGTSSKFSDFIKRKCFLKYSKEK